MTGALDTPEYSQCFGTHPGRAFRLGEKMRSFNRNIA